jgi:guanine nucleotide-binding protein G(i) subunit alpha
VPTEADLVRSQPQQNGVTEHRFKSGRLSIRLIDVALQRNERRKWMNQFEDVTTVMFVVDLACYDDILLVSWSGAHAITEQLMLFDSVVNSRWFKHTSIILLLGNVSIFKHKLITKPLKNYYPEYSGGNDFDSAVKYLVRRFNQVSRAPRNVYPHLVDSYNGPDVLLNVRLVFAAVKQTKLQNQSRAQRVLSKVL